jgi:hypothetical protein
MQRVDDGNGNRFRMRESTARVYLSRHPNAFIVGQRVQPEVSVPAPSPDGPNLNMTRAELDAYAAEHGINTSEARTKADVLALIEGTS